MRRGFTWVIAGGVLAIALFAGLDALRSSRSETALPTATGSTVDDTANLSSAKEIDSQTYNLLDGEVIFSAASSSWRFSDNDSGPNISTLLYGGFEGIRIVTDPLPVGVGCEADAAAADAEALAERVLSDPDIESTEPIPIRIAGIEALQMDVAPSPRGSICDRSNESVLFTSDEPGNFTDVSLWHRRSYRLYLLDVPAGSSQILGIVIFGRHRGFETVVDAASPIMDSFEFHPG